MERFLRYCTETAEYRYILQSFSKILTSATLIFDKSAPKCTGHYKGTRIKAFQDFYVHPWNSFWDIVRKQLNTAKFCQVSSKFWPPRLWYLINQHQDVNGTLKGTRMIPSKDFMSIHKTVFEILSNKSSIQLKSAKFRPLWPQYLDNHPQNQ